MRPELQWGLMMGDTKEIMKIRRDNLQQVLQDLNRRLLSSSKRRVLSGMASAASSQFEPASRFVAFYRRLNDPPDSVAMRSFETMEALLLAIYLVGSRAKLVACVDVDEGKLVEPLALYHTADLMGLLRSHVQ